MYRNFSLNVVLKNDNYVCKKWITQWSRNTLYSNRNLRKQITHWLRFNVWRWKTEYLLLLVPVLFEFISICRMLDTICKYYQLSSMVNNAWIVSLYYAGIIGLLKVVGTVSVVGQYFILHTDKISYNYIIEELYLLVVHM